MKNITQHLPKATLFFISLLLLTTSCHKKKPVDYIPGAWGVLTYIESGKDKTSDFNITFQGYKITFDAKGNFTEYYRTILGEVTITGTWTLDNNNTHLTLVDNNPNSTNKIRIYTVLQLTETVFNVGESNKEYDLRKQ